MGTFFAVLLVFGLVVAGMSIGVIMGRKPISGSCGGMSALGIDKACDICGGDTSKCDEENQRVSTSGEKTVSLAYDAAQRPK